MQIAPPSQLCTNALLLMWAHSNAKRTLEVADGGGQDWTPLSDRVDASAGSTRWFWAVFNGAWANAPAVATTRAMWGSLSAGMVAFCPSDSANTWEPEAEIAYNGYDTPAAPYGITIPGRTPVADSTVNVALWTSTHHAEWNLSADSGWANPGTETQWRNSDVYTSVSMAYKIQTEAVSTGDVTNQQAGDHAGGAGMTSLVAFKEVNNLGTVPMYSVYEIELNSTQATAYDNPFTDIDVTATFTGPSGQIRTAVGFYDGDDTWRVRFSCDELGTWTYETAATDTSNAGLTGRTGSLACSEPAAEDHGFIKPDSDRKYYFSFSDDTPFYGIGDTAYFMTTSLSEEQIDDYLDMRKAQGFNFIRFFASGDPAAIHSEVSIEDGFAWKGKGVWAADYDRLNVNYFRRLERILAKLKARGMYAEIEVYNYYSYPFLLHDPLHPARDWTEQRGNLWGKYVVSRLAAYSTVFLWTVTNEYEVYPDHNYRTYDEQDDIWAKAMGKLFHDNDPQGHPTTVHNFSFDDDKDHGIGLRFGESADIDVLSHQKWGVDAYGYDIEDVIAVDRKYGKPVINTENGYEFLTGYLGVGAASTTEQARRAAWRILVGGGATYAAGFSGAWRGKDPFVNRYATWLPFELRDEGLADNITQYATFINDVLQHSYRDMEPATDLVADDNVCLAKAGEEYIVYAPTGGAVTLNLAGTENTFTAQWFNPRIGGTQAAPDDDEIDNVVLGGATRTFISPTAGSGEDWVLHVKRN